MSVTLEADFWREAIQEALARNGSRDIFYGDKGSHFASIDFIKVPVDWEIKIRMGEKGAWRDSVFVERLLRTI